MSKQPKKGNTMSKSNTAKKTVSDVVDVIQSGELSKLAEVSDVNQPAVDDKGRKTEVKMSMEELEKKGLKNKSQVIRYLAGEKYAPAAIARFLDIRYQHVRNVLNQPLKRPVAPVATATKEPAEAE